MMMMMMTVGSLLLPAVPFFFFFLIINPTTLKKIYRHILSFCAVPKKKGVGNSQVFFFSFPRLRFMLRAFQCSDNSETRQWPSFKKKKRKKWLWCKRTFFLLIRVRDSLFLLFISCIYYTGTHRCLFRCIFLSNLDK